MRNTFMIFKIKGIVLLLVLIAFFSCSVDTNNKSKIQFYHWKIDATLSNKEKEAINNTDTTKTFIHYFDVVVSENTAHPVAVLQNMDAVFKEREVVPVVFIRNDVFKNKEISIKKLALKIEKLAQQIHNRYLGKNTQEIQIDCDWSGSTKNQYFQFLKILKQNLKISVTIRLHQIKYTKETGVPPVSYGVLMLYNVNDLSDFKQNSILSNHIVKQYIYKNSSYPLTLDVALPLFSQVVIKNKENKLRLINHVVVDDFKKDTLHFKKLETNIYKVKEKLLYKGQYLYKDFLLKLETSDFNEVVNSYHTVEESNLNIRNIILYHLDEAELETHTYKKLITTIQKERE